MCDTRFKLIRRKHFFLGDWFASNLLNTRACKRKHIDNQSREA
jgi:hypothetical protein